MSNVPRDQGGSGVPVCANSGSAANRSSTNRDRIAPAYAVRPIVSADLGPSHLRAHGADRGEEAMKPAAKALLVDGKVECTTCHVTHDEPAELRYCLRAADDALRRLPRSAVIPSVARDLGGRGWRAARPSRSLATLGMTLLLRGHHLIRVRGPRHLRRRVLLELLHHHGDGALQLRVAAGDDVG